MATTSGLINTITYTALQLITDALEDLRVVMDGQAPTAGDITKGLRKCNFVLKRWCTLGALLWCRDTIPIPEVTNKFRYTIGPTGDVVSYRPLRAFDTSFIRVTCGTPSPNDIPLVMLSRKEYFQLSYKGTVATTSSFYYDPQMAPTPFTAYDAYSQANGVLYIWTAPADMTRTIMLDVQRPIQDVAAETDLLDIPLEWYDTFQLDLKAHLADAFEVPEQRLLRIKAEAKAAVDELAGWGATEQTPISFTPDWRMNTLRGAR
jgi:hypothetical protein